jgi:hypothetical protein
MTMRSITPLAFAFEIIDFGNTSENTLVTQANACVFSADTAVISPL